MVRFTYRCPGCSVELKLTAPQPGKLVKCAKCGAVFRLGEDIVPPTPAPETKATTPPAPTPKPKAVAPRPNVAAPTLEAVEPAARRRPAARRDEEEEDVRPRRRPAPRNSLGLLIGLGVGAVVLMAVGGFCIVGGLAMLYGGGRPAVAVAATDSTDPSNPGDQTRNPVFDGPLPDIQPVPAGATPVLVLDPGGHTSTVRKVLFTPDGSHVVSVSWDKTVRVWDAKTGETLRTIYLPVGPGEEGTLEAAAVSPDGKLLAVGGHPVGDGKDGHPFYVLSLETGQIEAVVNGKNLFPLCLAFSRDSTLLAEGGTDGRILVYQAPGWRPVAELKGHTGSIRQVSFGPDAGQLVSGAKDGTLRLWDWREQKSRKTITAHAGGCNTVVWSDDGKTIVSGGTDGLVRFWSADGEPVFSLTFKEAAGPTQIVSLDVSRDGSRVVYGGIDSVGRAGVIDVAARRKVLDFPAHTNTVMSVAFAPDGKFVTSTGGNNHETFLWRAEDGQVVHRLYGAGKGIWGVGWGADGKSISWGNTNLGGTVNAGTKLERSFRFDTLELEDAPAANALRAPLAAGPYTLKALDFFRIQVTRNGQATLVLQSPIAGDRIYSVSMTTGDRAIVGGSFGLYLMDLRTGKVLRDYKGHTSIITGIAPSNDGRYFVTGSADETVRVWSVDRDTPLLSLFVAGSEWIAWSPEGYYAASPYGERLMGWQVNNGPDRNALYYPAVQFRASLYQPEVIRLLPSAGSLAAAVAQAARNGHPVSNLQLGQVLPPAVAITSPAAVPGGVPANGTTVEIKAVARSTGEHPVKAMRLLMDGRPYQGQAGVRVIDSPRLGSTGAAWSVALPPGRHVFAVQAESAVSKGLSAPVEIVSADNGELPTLYMVAIGVSAYPGKLRLQFAASDAQLMAQTFRQRGNGVFKKIDVHVIVDADATRARILKELDWLASVMTARDVAVVSFSGHGARDDDGNFFLVPVDASVRDISHTCVPGDVLKQRLGNLPGKVIAMLDACHSGTVAEDFAASRPDNLARDLVTDDCGVVVMCSSLGREYSLESPATRAGFFTLGVTEGLSGQADYNKDGVVFIHELDYYAAMRVQELSGGRQHTVTGKPPAIRSFPLSRP